MNLTRSRLALTTLAIGLLLMAIFAVMLVRSRNELREEIHQKIIERHATVLYSMAHAQLREAEPGPNQPAVNSATLLSAVLKTVQPEGIVVTPDAGGDDVIAMTIFDAEGNTLQAVPPSLLLAELPPGDYPRLLGNNPISRYHPDFPLDRYFSGIGGRPTQRRLPVLEVLLPLHARDGLWVLGFVQYYIDARHLTGELAAIDRRVTRQTLHILAIGGTLIAVVLTAGYGGMSRAQRIIAERNERLTRANFELSLAAKTSALGLITSHLIHGLQGPVAGLRAVMTDRGTSGGTALADWESAVGYTDRLQAMIAETVTLLGDAGTQTTYELTGRELATIIRNRSVSAAAAKGVILVVSDGFDQVLDSHRGGLLCLIATNLVQNAIEATDAGRRVSAALTHSAASIVLVVRDEGPGIPDLITAHLFEPGYSGRPGGSGLGLAISHLLARQIGATLALESTGENGTTFRLILPLG
jgi:signal transduction histidine kinase